MAERCPQDGGNLLRGDPAVDFIQGVEVEGCGLGWPPQLQ